MSTGWYLPVRELSNVAARTARNKPKLWDTFWQEAGDQNILSLQQLRILKRAEKFEAQDGQFYELDMLEAPSMDLKVFFTIYLFIFILNNLVNNNIISIKKYNKLQEF